MKMILERVSEMNQNHVSASEQRSFPQRREPSPHVHIISPLTDTLLCRYTVLFTAYKWASPWRRRSEINADRLVETMVRYF